MGQILLFDPDAEHARQIAAAFRCISTQTVICADTQTAASLIDARAFDVAVVVALPGLDWDLPVEFIRHSALRRAEPPQIVCLLRGPYRGPSVRVYAARKGFKVVYEQEC